MADNSEYVDEIFQIGLVRASKKCLAEAIDEIKISFVVVENAEIRKKFLNSHDCFCDCIKLKLIDSILLF